MQKYLQNLQNLMCIQEKLKVCEFPSKVSEQKSHQSFIAKIVRSASFY